MGKRSTGCPCPPAVDARTGTVRQDTEAAASALPAAPGNLLHTPHLQISSLKKQSTFSGDNGKDMQTHYENLKNILLRLKDSLDNGTFSGTGDKDACKKCYYRDYCNKKQ